MFESSRRFAEGLECKQMNILNTGAVCGADENMSVRSDQGRNSQPRPFHESSELTLLPPRPWSSRDVGPSSGFELLGLQVQGICCPLQQRPSRGRTIHRVTPQSHGGGEGSLTLLGREKPVSRSRTGNRPEVMPGASRVCSLGAAVSEAAETPTTPCIQQQALHAQPSAMMTSELHVYLPSWLCEDEEQDSEPAEMRTAEDTITAEPQTSVRMTTTGPTLHSTTSENITEEEPEHS